MPSILEQASVKVAAKLGGFRASLNGLTGVFRKLSEEHKEVELLLERAAVAPDAEKRADLWTTLRAELVAHERAEITHVYVECVSPESIFDVGEEHEAEALKLDALIGELDELAFDSPEWPLAIEQLSYAVARHIEIEEERYFPKLQALIGEARAKELELLYARAKLAIVHDLD